MEDLLWFNGQDAHDLGFILEDAPDLLGSGAVSVQTSAVPQGVGAVLASVPAAVAPRVIRLTGFTTDSTVSAATTTLHRVKAAIGNGLVEIRSAWAPTLIGRGVLLTTTAGPSSTAWTGRVSLDLEFLLPDPHLYDVEPVTVAFPTIDAGGTRYPVDVPLGTASSRGRETWGAIITIYGPATTPTLTEYDSSGTARRTMVFTNSPGATDAIEIDIGRGLVTAIASGVRSNGYANLTAGYEFPTLDPADGDYYTSQWPKLSVSSGLATIRYYKAYR